MDASYRILTSQGRGAIAVVSVRGPDALEVADATFRPRRGVSLGQTRSGRPRLGRAGVGEGDEVVAVRCDAVSPTVEFHCHGGAAAVAALAIALERAGAVREAVDFRSSEDRIRSQALEDLAAAPTLRSAEILLDQANGALGQALDSLIMDARRGQATLDRSSSLAELQELIHRGQVGTRLLGGWTVVIAGRPNVGKSRLFNALAGFDRSIVNPRAGVTRDVVTFRTAFGGWPVELADTAGERDSEDAVERLGIGRARQKREDADLILLVLDRSESLTDVDRILLGDAGPNFLVANKCDQAPAWELDALAGAGDSGFAVSAETGEGIDSLIRAMVSRLVRVPPPPGAAVPFRAEHLLKLEAARESLAGRDVAGFTAALDAIRGLAHARSDEHPMGLE